MYLRHLRDFIKANARTPWAMLELSPHGFIGKLFKNKDLPKLVMILRAFYLEQPCDFLIKPYFINIMTQKKPIVRKSALFFHKGQFSSLKNVTRKIDKYSGGAVVRKNAESAVRKIAMVTRAHKNPPAKVYVNMTEFNGNHISGAYDPMTLGFFWARDVKAGQYVRILFNTPQKVERLVVETGFSDKERKDILRKGSVEMGLDVPNMAAGTNRCPNTHKMGEFQDGSFDATLTLKDDVRCINIVVDQTQTEWLIIRQILVFVTKVPVPPKM
ncbi:alpha-1,3-mannosyl-glycoprotein 4-beta-N-acetylglucosaminyltransferase C-like [Littorina saxatilis]|uniref:alpha-1,3-mannosyl-glycoprotein 4-beta-N-acetylglucosaminyltransferase C-like n=1 Tax=Littorina saxatilis TaxID=31220 RepID=UPI0038B516B1